MTKKEIKTAQDLLNWINFFIQSSSTVSTSWDKVSLGLKFSNIDAANSYKLSSFVGDFNFYSVVLDALDASGVDYPTNTGLSLIASRGLIPPQPKPSGPKKCTCAKFNVVHFGCKCGGI